MCLTIYQQIHINFLKVEAITNSSVLQVGSSGTIQAVSNAYNTGGYTEPAEEPEPAGEVETNGEEENIVSMPLVPFTN